jgi:hypothetical protein
MVIVILFLLGFYAVIQIQDRTGPVRLDPYITDPSCSAPSERLMGYYGTDTNPDPIFRAGTIPFFSERYLGHGFLIIRSDRLYYVTAEHVADIAQGDCAYYYFAGADFFALARFSYYSFSSNHRAEEDELAEFQITGNLFERLAPLIRAGQITPMIPTYQVPDPGAIVAIPNAETGDYTLYRIDSVHHSYITLGTNGQQGLVCGGRSGSPVLLVQGNSVTNLAIGIISSINENTMFDTVDGNHCGYIAYAIRF